VWQGGYQLPSLQRKERSPLQSGAWRRRETIDGLYYYFINLNDGTMTDPHPVPRDDLDGDDIYEARKSEYSSLLRRRNESSRSNTDHNLLHRLAVPSYWNKNLRNSKISGQTFHPSSRSGSTNQLKDSRSSSEVFPPSPRSHYEYPRKAKLDLYKSVLKRSSTKPQLFPLPPLPSYHPPNSHY